jgi:hypothetical protein
MLETVIKWHDVTEELPEKSGAYFIHSYSFHEVHYSSKHKLFNAQDYYTEDEAKGYAIYPNYWAELPELPAKDLED